MSFCSLLQLNAQIVMCNMEWEGGGGRERERGLLNHEVVSCNNC